MPDTPPDTAPQDRGLRVTVGKYTVVSDGAGWLHALRNGEQWRDCTGDNLICMMAHAIESLRAAGRAAHAHISALDMGGTDTAAVLAQLEDAACGSKKV